MVEDGASNDRGVVAAVVVYRRRRRHTVRVENLENVVTKALYCCVADHGAGRFCRGRTHCEVLGKIHTPYRNIVVYSHDVCDHQEREEVVVRKGGLVYSSSGFRRQRRQGDSVLPVCCDVSEIDGQEGWTGS